MSVTTSASLFTGGAGFEQGAMMAGFSPVWGVEIRPDIAAVAEANTPGLKVIVSDVAAVDYSSLAKVDHLHASPSCKKASIANSEGGECDEDIAAALAVVNALWILQPQSFSLENVWGYREFESFKKIVRCLTGIGYFVDWWHLNSADYGGLILCPLHDTVDYAGKNWVRETAQDIVKVAAMMRPEDQARILAWDVVARLEKSIQQDIAEDAICSRLLKNVTKLEKGVLAGKADELLMNVGMFISEPTDGMFGSIGWLLKRCLVDPCIKERWSIMSMVTKRITALKILECFLATRTTSQNITSKDEKKIPAGKLETDGEPVNCPLCKYTAVPQTRQRLILIARLDRQPRKPQPTHSDTPDPWGVYKPWVGWLEAIEDLIDTLPESQFANWQLARLPAELKSMLLVQGGYEDEIVNREPGEPAFTVTSNSNQAGVRAFLMWAENMNQQGSKEGRWLEEPAMTVPSHPAYPRAFLLNKSADKYGDGVNYAESPAFSVVSSSQGKYKAFLTSDNYGSPNDTGQERILQLYSPDDPAMTVTAQAKRLMKAGITGRVVKMTPRALARFMSLDDSYTLPAANGLACEIIGNMVCPLLAKAICESLS